MEKVTPTLSRVADGRYVAENNESIWDEYRIVMDVRETAKSFIFSLVDLKSRYSASHMAMLFSKSKRAVIKKARSPHAMRIWPDGSFTLYPYQAGIPFYFRPLEENSYDRNKAREV